MSLTQSAIVALAGLSLGTAALPVQAQSGLTVTPQSICGEEAGVATGVWLSFMNKPDELTGILFGPGGNDLYELRAQLSANYYTTSGGVTIQPLVGGLFGNLYDALDPTVPIANVLGSWSKSASGLGQFEAVVLELDSKYVLGGQVMGEIRGMFGPSDLLPEPPVLIVDPPPPGPNVLIDVLERPHDAHNNLEDDVILSDATIVLASDKQKTANRAGMGASGQSSGSPAPAMSSGELNRIELQPYGDDVILSDATIVLASGKQKSANRAGAGAGQIVDHPYGDDVILSDATIVLASDQQKTANRAGMGASGKSGSSPHPSGPALYQSAQASGQQKSANRAGVHFQGEGEPVTEPHGYIPHSPSPSGQDASMQAQQADGSYQGIGMQLPTSGAGAQQIGAAGSEKTANRAGLNLNQQPQSGGFVGTWVLCF